MLASVLTPWRMKMYTRGALAALALAFVAILLSGSGTETLTGRLGGDYPAFYTAGQMIADGESDRLYSISQQRAYQRPLIGEETGVLPFAYPPQFALAYVPLSQLPFRLSYAVHTILMVAALALACALIARIYPGLVTKPELLFFLALTSFPILRAVMGAQNTALSLLLIVLIWYKVLHNKHYQAGVFLGLLFFKPQFALPLSGLFFLSGRWRVWLSAAATAAIVLGLSTALLGTGWIDDWLSLVQIFSGLDIRVNFAELVSWQGFVGALVGEGNPAAVIGWGLALATVLALSWSWFAGGCTGDFNAQMALASAGIVLISPHTLFYDAGIALIAIVVLLSRLAQPNAGFILAIWAAGWLQLVSPAVGVSLTFVPLVLISALAVAYLWRASLNRAVAQTA